MYTKTLLTLIFFALLTLIYLYLIGSPTINSHMLAFFRSIPGPALSPTPTWVPPVPPPSPCPDLNPLRVYMYDLPREFNVGMIDRGAHVVGNVTAVNFPTWPYVSGLGKQHSVEYWMMGSLLYESGSESEVVRVSDPEDAEVFFVPFFSSLSYNIYGVHTVDQDDGKDKQLQVDMMKFLRESKYWQRSGGRDHVIPMHHPNALKFVRQELTASILIVSDFGRYPKSMANLRKDVVAPYGHVLNSYTNDEISDPFESRKTLLFFRGRTVRKDEGKVRGKLAKVLAGYEDVHYENSFASEDTIKLSIEGMRTSKFCLNPAGDTPSSCRLFDAIVNHCVPVIVSNKIELPFEDELDYSEFSIFFSTQEALKPGYMVEQLRQVPKERWVNMWKILKNISNHFEFQNPPKKGDAINMLWRQVRHKVPSLMLAAHRTPRLKVPDWWGNRR